MTNNITAVKKLKVSEKFTRHVFSPAEYSFILNYRDCPEHVVNLLTSLAGEYADETRAERKSNKPSLRLIVGGAA